MMTIENRLMTYLDKYPNCNGCPVEKYCGTVVSSIRLCHSYNDDVAKKESLPVLTLSKATHNIGVASEADDIEGRITQWDNITD